MRREGMACLNTMGITKANGYYSYATLPGAIACLRGTKSHCHDDIARPPMTTSHDLKSAGLKATVPRLKIINLFETSRVRHLTAEDVYKILLAEGLDIGLATVYRVLTQFE